MLPASLGRPIYRSIGADHRSFRQCQREPRGARWCPQRALDGRKFQLSDSKSADILADSVEGFIARTPEELLEFLRAQLPEAASGRPDPDAVPRFLSGHPAGRAFVERLMKKPVPASYAQTIYYAEHAFRFTAADGTSRFGRYRFVPQAGESLLSPDDADKRNPSFLREELEGRLRTIRWSSGCSCNWPRPATRRTTSPLCGLRVGSDRARASASHRNLPDERGRRAASDLRPRQQDGRHRSLGRPDPAGPVGRLFHLL